MKIVVKNAVKRKKDCLYYIDTDGNLIEHKRGSSWEVESPKRPCKECSDSEAEYEYYGEEYCEECLEKYYVDNRMYENYSFDCFLTTDCKKLSDFSGSTKQ